MNTKYNNKVDPSTFISASLGGQAHLVKLDALVGDEDDFIPVGPAEAQDVGVLHLEHKPHQQGKQQGTF